MHITDLLEAVAGGMEGKGDGLDGQAGGGGGGQCLGGWCAWIMTL